MKNMIHAIIGLLFLIMFVSMSQTNGYAKTSIVKKDNHSQLLERIDFNNAYIMGQSIKSGAVYLLKRKSSNIQSMLEYRKDYRKEILEGFDVPGLSIKPSNNNRAMDFNVHFSGSDQANHSK